MIMWSVALKPGLCSDSESMMAVKKARHTEKVHNYKNALECSYMLVLIDSLRDLVEEVA